MDTATLHENFHPFHPGVVAQAQDKSIKEDLENADKIGWRNNDYLVAFGSGSVEKTREKALFFPVDSFQKFFMADVKTLYSSIQEQLNIPASQLNIEGSFSTADSFYLLNRGSNHLIAMDRSAVEELIDTRKFPATPFTTRAYALPLLDSFPISFSGACYYKEDKFLFTATVEKTTDWVEDGEVAGSWVGLASLDGTISFLLPLTNEKGALIKQKLESIALIQEHSNGDLSLFAISDNDNGQSTWFTLLLIRNNKN